jgi:mono/diheme cytochrome c family protein
MRPRGPEFLIHLVGTMTVRHLSSLVGVGALVASGVGLFLMGGLSADKRPSKAEEKLANLAKEVVIPLEAQSWRNPLAGDDAAVRQGMELYQQSCSVCHGSDGRSDIAFGRAMYPPAMDLTSPHVRKWKDAELFWIIANGVRFTGMPAWHALLDEPSTWKLVLAIRQLQQAGPKAEASSVALTAAERIHEGALLFRQQNCVGCHRLHGEGGRVGPDLSDEGDRGRSNAWMIGHFKNPGAFVPGSLMPATINLNADQLLALTEFLQDQHRETRR